MGNPSNYALELPQRCLRLLETLWPNAEKTFPAEGPRLGPLTATFLISMSMPIINLPIERIERRVNAADMQLGNDRDIDPRVTEAIIDTLQRRRLGEAPFYVRGAWRFVTYRNGPPPILGRGLPHDVALSLQGERAAIDAAEMRADQWSSTLRNALAHGGILYLDEDGQSTFERPVKMYAFFSIWHEGVGPRKRLAGVNFLRISESDYKDFLRRWVDWLVQTGIAKAAEAA